jgi:cobalt-zinc-cadmium efflux system protein
MRDRSECGNGHAHGPSLAEAARTRRNNGPRDEVLAGRRGLRYALAITIVFMLAEAFGGWLANSLALMADAGHMLTDAAAIALSLFAIRFAALPATRRRSYGFLRIEILAALANGVLLVLISVGIFYEAWQRFVRPPAVRVPLMLGIAAAGLVANLLAAAALHRSSEGHLNARAAYLHVLSDTLGSVGAIVAGAIMFFTGWYVADPIISALVGLLILVSAVKILQQSVEVLLEAVPSHIDLMRMERELAAVEGVRSVHDLHVWTISSGIHLMTCHAVVGGHGDHHEVLERLSCVMRERFGIEHTTIQLECEDLSPKEVGTGFCDRC